MLRPALFLVHVPSHVHVLSLIHTASHPHAFMSSSLPVKKSSLVTSSFSPHLTLLFSHHCAVSWFFNMLVLKSRWICEARCYQFFFLFIRVIFGIGLTVTVSILSWEEVYCIVTTVGGYGWIIKTQLGTIR